MMRAARMGRVRKSTLPSEKQDEKAGRWPVFVTDRTGLTLFPIRPSCHNRDFRGLTLQGTNHEHIAMVYRKGELSSAGVDSGWPHQVALPARLCSGDNHALQREFCIRLELSLCPRGHSVFFKDEWYRVQCFADRAHAEAFLARFGGEWFDPRDRGRGRHWMKWKRPSPFR